MSSDSDSDALLQRSARVYGVVRAVVTNNQDDPYKIGRIKVRFINLPQAAESAWARIAAPMAGNGFGLFCLPEVKDEVLVVFEQGDIDKPVIVGALWNGATPPPYNNADGKNNQRIFRSRSGHSVLFDDTDGKGQLIVQDSTGQNQLVFDAKNNVVTLQSSKDIVISAKGNIALQSQGDVNVSCANFNVTAQQTATVNATQSLDLKCQSGVKLNTDGLVVV